MHKRIKWQFSEYASWIRTGICKLCAWFISTGYYVVDSHSEDPRSACVRLCNEVQKKKINIAGNPLMVRLRRCQWKAGTLRRHSYGNSLLSPAVTGGSDYVSTLIGYWCPINDTLTHTCTHALESARTHAAAFMYSIMPEDKISVTKCICLYSFII